MIPYRRKKMRFVVLPHNVHVLVLVQVGRCRSWTEAAATISKEETLLAATCHIDTQVKPWEA